MPPISPQGSRTGIVTTLVIFVILFVTTTILWIYESAERRNRDDQIAEYRKRLTDVVDEATIAGPDVQALTTAARENPAYLRSRVPGTRSGRVQAVGATLRGWQPPGRSCSTSGEKAA